MPLIKDDHVVETLTSNGADHPFDKWILPRGARCGKDLLYPETVDASIEVRSVGLVSIPSCAKTRSRRVQKHKRTQDRRAGRFRIRGKSSGASAIKCWRPAPNPSAC